MMKKSTMGWLIAAAVLVTLGMGILVGVLRACGRSTSGLSTEKYGTATYEITETFHSIRINTDTADVLFVLSGDGKCKVECYEPENAKHTVKVEAGQLMVEPADEKEWYDHIGIYVETPKITVYLPEAEYASLFLLTETGDLEIPEGFLFENAEIAAGTGDVTFAASAHETIKIRVSTGDIRLENASAGFLELSASTGKITVSDVTCEGDAKISESTGKSSFRNFRCQNLSVIASTGDVLLESVIAVDKISIEANTSDIRFEGSDASEMTVKTTTGDIRGSLLTKKTFVTQTDTGSVDVPHTSGGGRCELTTDTGDIEITLSQN